MFLLRPTLVCLALLLSALVSPSLAGDAVSEEAAESAEEEYRRIYMRGFMKGMYETLLPRAEAGDADAQFHLSLLIGAGVDLGMPVDLGTLVQDEDLRRRNELRITEDRYRQALKWLKRAALQEHSAALDILATSHRYGTFGLTENPALADCWDAVSDGHGTPEACVELERQQLGTPTEMPPP